MNIINYLYSIYSLGKNKNLNKIILNYKNDINQNIFDSFIRDFSLK
jgi:hypothetical protein